MSNRIREIFRGLYDRLVFVPVVFVVLGLLAGLGSVRLDRRTSDDWLPSPLRTTVSSADSILSTIAGGLISAITLLLSLTLVAVQLASGRFSPRTIADWIGDRTQQLTIGLVLGTTVFCLMVLRETQASEDGNDVNPDISVLAAVALMILCLIAVVRSVGHLSNRMQVGTVARSLMEDTVAAVRERGADGRTLPVNRSSPIGTGTSGRPSADWVAAVSARSGWVQDLDCDRLATFAEPGSAIHVVAPVGTFLLPTEPVAWIERPIAAECDEIEINDSVVSIGPERRVDNNPAYGILQMSDVALRALSPGVNDPNTACDLVSYLGVVLLALWEQIPAETEFDAGGRSIRMREMSHAEYLDAALAQIVRYGVGDVDVARTIITTLDALEAEIARRELPGPVEPIADLREYVAEAVRASDLLPVDRDRLVAAARRR